MVSWRRLHSTCTLQHCRFNHFRPCKPPFTMLTTTHVTLQYGDTPLHYACFCGHTEAAKALIAAGADPNKPSRDGKTPIQSAAEEGHAPLLATLNLRPPTTPSRPAVAPVSSTPGYAAPAAPAFAPRPPSLPPTHKSGAVPPPTTTISPFANGPVGGAGVSVGGLDFSRGVILEGELKKKRKNKLMKWRNKYYVLSRTYGALFFWTGSRTRVGTLQLHHVVRALWLAAVP